MGITADENLAVKAGFELAVIVTYGVVLYIFLD